VCGSCSRIITPTTAQSLAFKKVIFHENSTVFRTTTLVSSLLMLLAGCSDSAPVKATWEYVQLTKESNGDVKEVGGKHTLRSGGDEMFEIHGKKLDVLTVTSTKAKFRLRTDDFKETKEAELPPGSSQDLWLDDFGVRVRVEKIGPI